MKRIIYYLGQDDNGTIITTKHCKELLTKNGDDFIEKLHRFYKDKCTSDILGIKENEKVYDLTTYINYHMSKNLYKKMMWKYYGKRY